MAVLYFSNLSRDSADALLADGFTEELIVRLGRVESLQVKSRGLVGRFRGQTDPMAVGRALNVAFVVSGTMRRSGDRVRITAEMARANTGTQAWADAFDRSSSDLMTIEADLAQSVATAIAGRLRPHDRASLMQRPTRNPAAWEAYLRGNALIARRASGGLAGAIEAYREAVRLDSAFAPAWGRLAEGLWLGSNYGYLDPTERANQQQVREAAARAMALDSLSAEAWLARGFVLMSDGRWPAGVAAFARAVTLDSNLAEAHYHLGAGLHAWTDDQTSAERHLGLAHTLDPTLLNAVQWLVALLWKAGRPLEALAWFDTLAAAAPRQYDVAVRNLGIADLHTDLLLSAGDTAAARTELEALLAGSWRMDSVAGPALAARLLFQLGDTTRARSFLRTAEQLGAVQSTPLNSACILASAYAALGERQRAVTVLEERRPDGAELWDRLRSPYFDSLRREPRFARLFEGVRPR